MERLDFFKFTYIVHLLEPDEESRQPDMGYVHTLSKYLSGTSFHASFDVFTKY